MNLIELAPDGIVVGERLRRLRPELVDELAASMAEVGLLQPIAVRREGGLQPFLVYGRHRLEAAIKLGWERIGCLVLGEDQVPAAELAEIDENLKRGDLSDAERAIHHQRRKQLEEAEGRATKHGATGGSNKGKGRSEVAKIATSVDTPAERYTKAAAKATGQKERTVQLDCRRGEELEHELPRVIGTSLDKGVELNALVQLKHASADAGPEIVADLVERAAAGEKVSAKVVAKQVRRDRRERTLAEAIETCAEAIGDGQLYGVILADPPWSRETYSEAGKDRDPANHYPTMTEAELAALPLPAAERCVLFLWSTQEHLAQAMRLIEAWGFAYKSGAVWAKPRSGTGYWFRTRHELLLVATRGAPVAPAPGQQMDSVFEAPVGRHSEKPPVIHEMIERLWPATPKLEMFARSARKGWRVWGAEAGAPKAAGA